MALLATFTNAGLYSMINGPADQTGTFCVAHGLTTTPDFAKFISSGTTALVSAPIGIVSRTATAVIARTNTGSVGISAEMFAQVVHSIVR